MAKVRALTYADDDREIPPRPVEGELLKRWVPTLSYWQHWVGNTQVDPATVSVLDEDLPPTSALVNYFDLTSNIYCATGKGGGVDPTCGRGEGKPSKEQVLSHFGSWGYTSRSGKLVGFRGGSGANLRGSGENFPGDELGTEGVGPYISRDKDLAESFGEAKEVKFDPPENPLVVDEHEELHILNESEEILRPIKLSDSVWTKANKEAAKRIKTTEKNWGKKSSGELQRELTKVLLEKGYDSVLVKSGGQEWVILLDKKRFSTSVRNVYCPTGEGGGIDPSCSPGGWRKTGEGTYRNVYTGRVVKGSKPPPHNPPSLEGVRKRIAAISSGKEALSKDAVLELGGQLMEMSRDKLRTLSSEVKSRLSGAKARIAEELAKRVLGKKSLPGEAGKPETKTITKEVSSVPEQQQQLATDRSPSGGTSAAATATGGRVEGASGSAGLATPDHGGNGRGVSAGEGPLGRVSISDPVKRERVAAALSDVNNRIGKYRDMFRAKGQHEVAGWMDKLQEHINQVGVDEALKGLGKDLGGLNRTNAPMYEGGWDPEAFKNDKGEIEDGLGHYLATFSRDYLNRHGIVHTFQTGGKADPKKKLISSASPEQVRSGNAPPLARPDPFHAGDFTPADPTFKDKLEEAKHLPGLEKSEDINKIVGKKVTHLTPEVIAKLDERYGKGQWIVKAYGEEAAAGYGIFFPQRAEQIPKDAQGAIWAAGENLARYGFQLHRNKDGDVDGVQHGSGVKYLFGTDEYKNAIYGDAKHWADLAASHAEHEKAAALPGGGKDFMAQPAFKVVGVSDADRAAGKTIVKGEGRVHIATRNGRATIIPHSTWLKGENLPVVFENDDTRAMAQAALDAINALPASERQGQIYAPDIIRGEAGYRVIEANPANETGSSGYLGNNPLIIDSYVSHLSGRTPAHVRFIRRLLTTSKRAA